jgi:hypothetical protein
MTLDDEYGNENDSTQQSNSTRERGEKEDGGGEDCYREAHKNP